MNDNEIIKALECCYNAKCSECPCYTRCVKDMSKNALDLINRQQAEIERLQEQDKTAEKIIREQGGTILHLKDENSRLLDRNCELSEKSEKAVIACIAARNEIIKEFAEMLKAKAEYFWEEKESFVPETDIDNLVKEIVGDTK